MTSRCGGSVALRRAASCRWQKTIGQAAPWLKTTPHRICRRSLNALANAMRRRLARNTTKTPSRGQPIRAVTSTSPQRNGPSTIAPWRRGKNVGGEDRHQYIETSLAAQAGRSVKLIEGTIEPTAVEATVLPALEPPKPKSRLMLTADAAVRPRVRKPRQRRMPSPASA